MKLLTRDFTIREKILIAVLSVILIGLLYIKFIHFPVEEALVNAASEKAALQTELDAVNAQVMSLKRKQDELNGIAEAEDNTYMPSYNNERNVAKLLNDVLGDYGYSINFANVTRDGNQIRRNISLQFTAPDYESVEKVLSEFANSEYRCLIGDINGSAARGSSGGYSINTMLTFYETMVGGTPDAGLPK